MLSRLFALSIAYTCLAWLPAAADDKAQAAPDFSKGLLSGKVVDTVTGKPIPDATVALQDKDNKVLAWGKTNANGVYCIAVDSLKVLNLHPSRRRGLLDEIVKGAGQVVTAPIKIASGVVDTVKKTNPIETVKNATVSTVTGNPVPIATQVVSTATSVVNPAGATQQSKELAVRSAFGERLDNKQTQKAALAPGEVFVSISRPDYKEIKGKAGVYWLECPVLPEKGKKDDKGRGVCARMESVKLAPTAAADKKSEIVSEAVLLSEPKMEPAGLITAGGVAKISVKLQCPPETPGKIRVFAREDKKKTTIELKPQGKDIYYGEMQVDVKCPSGDTKISIVALREEPIEVKLPKSKDDPLLLFASRLDDLEPQKPYEYDPRILASENRLDIAVTVLDPKQQTPPSKPKPADKK